MAGARIGVVSMSAWPVAAASSMASRSRSAADRGYSSAPKHVLRSQAAEVKRLHGGGAYLRLVSRCAYTDRCWGVAPQAARARRVVPRTRLTTSPGIVGTTYGAAHEGRYVEITLAASGVRMATPALKVAVAERFVWSSTSKELRFSTISKNSGFRGPGSG